MRGTWTSIVSAFALCASVFASDWENTHYTRNIDLSKGYVQESCVVSAKNIGTEPQSIYYFKLNDGLKQTAKLSAFVASLLNQGIAIEAVSLPEDPYTYKLTLPIPVAPGSEVEFKTRYIYSDAITPLPEKIDLSAEQSLLLKLNKYVYSDYLTKEYTLLFSGITKGQEMEILGGFDEDITMSNNTEGLPVTEPRVENQSLVYGPIFVDIEPYTISAMGLLYKHNRPLAKVNNLQRSIWIPASQSNKISFEEYYELTNSGAQLSSGFSRLDWMKGGYEKTKNHWAISQIDIKLPEGEIPQDIYYTDKVGQVSTSKVFSDHLILQPRYPIFGGWKYNFTIGWNNVLGEYLHKVHDAEDTYIVKFPLLSTIKDVTYENVEMNFYLPEDAEFIGVSSAVEFDDLIVSNENSYFDVSKGHVKVTLKFANLIDGLSKVDVFVQYKYTKASYFWKVFKISGFVFVGLLSYYLLSLIDVSIEKEKK